MYKNVAAQKLALYFVDLTTGGPKTGDAANLTAYVSKDAAAPAALADTSAAELSSSNAPGWYTWDVAQAESNADMLVFSGKSSTGSVQCDGMAVFTKVAVAADIAALIAWCNLKRGLKLDQFPPIL